MTARDFLLEYLSHAPVALALLRAIECRELAELGLDAPILDLGCGDGLFGELFLRPREAIGLDRAGPELRAAARRNVYRALICGDIGRLPFADASFATVFSNGVLEHVCNLQQGVQEIHRILRPGGRLICTVPTMEDERQLAGASILRAFGLQGLSQLYAEGYNRFFGQVNLYNAEGWRRIFAEAGLHLVHHRAYAPASVFRLHDLTMPFSLPAFLCKRLTGRWVLWPGFRRATIARLWTRFLKRIYADQSLPGCSLLLVAVREQAAPEDQAFAAANASQGVTTLEAMCPRGNR